MDSRPLTLPRGWYANTEREMREYLSLWKDFILPNNSQSTAAILPHAGWYYSGHYAYQFFTSLNYKPDLVILFGGHLLAGEPILKWDFNSCDTPFGALPVDLDLLGEMEKTISMQQDLRRDNSIEVFLPLLRWFWPETKILALRIPPDKKKLGLAENWWDLIRQYSDRPLLIGSSDLTHYGSNYNFFPELQGLEPKDWVKKNDKKILDALLEKRSSSIPEIAAENSNSCSAGAVAMTGRISEIQGWEPELIQYGSSLDRGPSDSFVGYATLSFQSGLN